MIYIMISDIIYQLIYIMRNPNFDRRIMYLGQSRNFNRKDRFILLNNGSMF